MTETQKNNKAATTKPEEIKPEEKTKSEAKENTVEIVSVERLSYEIMKRESEGYRMVQGIRAAEVRLNTIGFEIEQLKSRQAKQSVILQETAESETPPQAGENNTEQ